MKRLIILLLFAPLVALSQTDSIIENQKVIDSLASVNSPHGHLIQFTNCYFNFSDSHLRFFLKEFAKIESGYDLLKHKKDNGYLLTWVFEGYFNISYFVPYLNNENKMPILSVNVTGGLDEVFLLLNTFWGNKNEKEKSITFKYLNDKITYTPNLKNHKATITIVPNK